MYLSIRHACCPCAWQLHAFSWLQDNTLCRPDATRFKNSIWPVTTRFCKRLLVFFSPDMSSRIKQSNVTAALLTGLYNIRWYTQHKYAWLVSLQHIRYTSQYCSHRLLTLGRDSCSYYLLFDTLLLQLFSLISCIFYSLYMYMSGSECTKLKHTQTTNRFCLW